jgi:uncharacterized protein YciI
MMPFAVNLTFGHDPHTAIRRLRRPHLSYIRDTLDQILAGGSVRGDDGTLDEDIIILRTDDRPAAEAWVAAEPFSASGEVFTGVAIRRWSQVVPETGAGALDQEIEHVATMANDHPR